MDVQDASERDPSVLGSRSAASYEHIGAGVVEIDRKGRMLRVNQQFCQLTGFSRSELLGRNIFRMNLSEDVGPDWAQFNRQAAGAIDRYTVEKRFRKKDGGLFWAEVTSSSVHDADGAFLYAVRVQHDITARKQAEQALARRTEEQAALVQFSECLQHADSVEEIDGVALEAIMRALDCERASILRFDDAGVMRFVAWRGLSDAYRQAVEGHSPWAPGEEVPRPVLVEDVSASDLPGALKAALLAEGIAAVAFIPILQNGRLAGKFMAYYGRPNRLSLPEIAVALTIARQLSFSVARFRAEEDRRAAERNAAQLVAIVESSDDAIISKNRQGVIQTWNAGAERLFGYRAEEAIGRPVTIIFPPERENEEPGILSRILRGERIDHYETVRRRKDGSLVDISLTVSPMRDSAGIIIGASKIARDITERKQAERQQRLLLDELNHRIKNNMQMLVSLLSSSARKVSSEEAKRALDEACGRIAAMAAAQRVLYGRADAHHFDADEFLKAVCETIRQTLSPEIRIVSQPANGELSNEVAMPLALIVNELVTNAVKHGVRNRNNDSVRVSLREYDSQLCLSVEDDGEGFDLNAVQRRSSGLQLVGGLARQLQGSFEVTRNPSRACLRFTASRSP